MKAYCGFLTVALALELSVYIQGSPISRLSKHRNIQLLPSNGLCGIQSIQDKIFGGKVTSIDEFPWMAMIQYSKNGKNNGFQCGGTLINNKYVVTAAHCLVGNVNNLFGDPFNVRFGEHNLNEEIDCAVYTDGDIVCADPPVNVEVEEILPHPSYDDFSVNKYHDIGLIRLKEPVKSSYYVKPICLPVNKEKLEPKKILTVSGWGKTQKGTRSPIKLKADVPLVSNEECKRIYIDDVTIHDGQICAGGHEGIDSCNGDSGSPLMRTIKVAFYLEGIVSFGFSKCGTKGIPGVYTRVDKYIDWILDNIRP